MSRSLSCVGFTHTMNCALPFYSNQKTELLLLPSLASTLAQFSASTFSVTILGITTTTNKNFLVHATSQSAQTERNASKRSALCAECF